MPICRAAACVSLVLTIGCDLVYDVGRSPDASAADAELGASDAASVDAADPDAGACTEPCSRCEDGRLFERVAIAGALSVEISLAIDDAAEAVRWLALDAAYTTGQIIRVDGGRWLT